MRDEKLGEIESCKVAGGPRPRPPTLYEQVGEYQGAYRVACKLHPLLGFFLFRPVTRVILTEKAREIADHLMSVDSVDELMERLEGVPASKQEVSATGKNLDRYAKAINKARDRYLTTRNRLGSS